MGLGRIKVIACIVINFVSAYSSRAITLHATLKLIPMLQEIRKGSEIYGLGGVMEKHPEICQPLFVPGTETAVSTSL